MGIQYATDIADLYNNPANAAHLGEKAAAADSPPRKKRITLVHSRDRFMPLYKQEVHDEVMRRMKELGVEVVLGERPDLGDVKDDKPGEKRTLRLSDGREVEYDLLVSLRRQESAHHVRGREADDGRGIHRCDARVRSRIRS